MMATASSIAGKRLEPLPLLHDLQHHCVLQVDADQCIGYRLQIAYLPRFVLFAEFGVRHESTGVLKPLIGFCQSFVLFCHCLSLGSRDEKGLQPDSEPLAQRVG